MNMLLQENLPTQLHWTANFRCSWTAFREHLEASKYPIVSVEQTLVDTIQYNSVLFMNRLPIVSFFRQMSPLTVQTFRLKVLKCKINNLNMKVLQWYQIGDYLANFCFLLFGFRADCFAATAGWIAKDAHWNQCLNRHSFEAFVNSTSPFSLHFGRKCFLSDDIQIGFHFYKDS